MKVSAKSRYALAALIYMGQNYLVKETVTIFSLSEKLGISKIYLEQVFSLLRRRNIVTSTKGAQGGYRLARTPREISAYDILSAIEFSLFEPADMTVADKAPNIENVLQNDVFDKLGAVIPETLKKITLDSLAAKAESYDSEGYIYYL